MSLPIDGLLNKEMDRKDFLKHIAVGVVAATGASAILKNVMPTQGEQASTNAQTTNQAYGYGGSVYGGVNQNTVAKTTSTVKTVLR